MNNETKRDVFEDALRALEEFGEQGSSWEMAYDDLSARYYSASGDALPDETDNQKSCPYCHGAGNLNDTTDRNNDFQIKIDMYDPDDARLNVEYQGGADYEIVHINYCPMCGRKLGDD